MTNEPIAWMVYTLDGTSVCVTDNPADFTPEHRALPLFTSPPAREWVGLTDEEVADLGRHELWIKQFIRRVEAKLKERNHVN